MGFPSMCTRSPGNTLFPSWVGRLFMVTLPAEIQVSASLREQIPVEEINLFKLIEPSLFVSKGINFL